MLIPNNQRKEKIFLSRTEKELLEFIPVCDLFDAYDRLFIPGSRTVNVNFETGEIDNPSYYK
ncbi:MAG: hypothetical protein ACI9S8_001375 [Chlamydiales bacterium]|jgi:hypothetical protein